MQNFDLQNALRIAVIALCAGSVFLGCTQDPSTMSEASGASNHVLLANFLVADRASFVVQAEGYRGKTRLEITAGHGLGAISFEAVYQESNTDPKVAAALVVLRDRLNDPSVAAISQDFLVSGLGLTFEKFDQ